MGSWACRRSPQRLNFVMRTGVWPRCITLIVVGTRGRSVVSPRHTRYSAIPPAGRSMTLSATWPTSSLGRRTLSGLGRRSVHRGPPMFAPQRNVVSRQVP